MAYQSVELLTFSGVAEILSFGSMKCVAFHYYIASNDEFDHVARFIKTRMPGMLGIDW